MKKILYVVLFTILIVFFSINIFSLMNTSFFGYRIYKVGSGSMKPYLKVNDLIIIKKSDSYKNKDIVTYKCGNEFITHRIVSIKDNEIVTKGDANNTNDDPITQDKIVGKLIYKFRVFSFVSYLLYRPVTWIVLFILGFSALNMSIVRKKEEN